MTCPSVLNCGLYADGALAPEAGAEFERHLDDCAECTRRVAVLTGESRALRTAFRTAELPAVAPVFVPQASLAALAGWTTAVVLTVVLAWSSLASIAVPAWLKWLAPDVTGVGVDVLVALGRRLVGGDLLQELVALLPGLVLVAAATSVWLIVGRRQPRGPQLCLSLCLGLLLGVNAPSSHAFEVRRDEDRVVVQADETIDDTLIVMADNVLVEGKVTGDLIALGERVTLRGSVDGTLVVLGEELRVEAQVAESALMVGETVELWRAAFGSNAYAAGSEIAVGADTTVAGSAALAAGEADVHGQFGRDLLIAAQDATLLGSASGDLTAYAERVDVGASARVGGDVTARVRTDDDLQIADGATIEGEISVSTWPEEPNRYLTVGFYVGVLLRLAAAFVTGLVLLALVPGLRDVRLDTGGDLLTVSALGAVALVAVPVLAGAAALTLIGIPLGVLALLGWLVALYVSGIVVGAFLGRRLMSGEPRDAVTLLGGLAIVFVLINLPLVGGLLRLMVVILGLGVITRSLRDAWQMRPGASVA
jgi:cytoskeletal protein CcmA (bactofilin family)